MSKYIRQHDEKLRPKAPWKGDFTIHGSNYIGPGNPMDDYKPVSSDDWLAFEHDKAYTSLWDYLQFNTADQLFLESINNPDAKRYFTLKKAINDALGTTIHPKNKQLATRRMGNSDTRKRDQARMDQRDRDEQEAKRLRGSDENAGTSDDVDMAGPTAMARASGPGRHDGSETKVSPVNAVVLRPFMDTQNTILPYYHAPPAGFSLTTTTQATRVSGFSIRLNSIWDCVSHINFVEDPTPAADTADANQERPIMREWWQNVYRYWTVTKSEYKVKFWTETKNADGGELDIWCYHNGQQQPPLVDSAGNLVYSKYRQLHRHAHMKTLRITPITDTETGKYDNVVVFTGSYKPGHHSVHNSVAEDEFKETWHQRTEVPSLREVASFIIQPSERWNTASSNPFVNTNVKYSIEIIYHCQWKDLECKFQYPRPTDDETFTDFPVQFV